MIIIVSKKKDYHFKEVHKKALTLDEKVECLIGKKIFNSVILKNDKMKEKQVIVIDTSIIKMYSSLEFLELYFNNKGETY